MRSVTSKKILIYNPATGKHESADAILGCAGSTGGTGSTSGTSAGIADGTVSTTSTWSSSKIQSEIEAAATGSGTLASDFAALKADYEENTVIFAESIGSVTGHVGDMTKLETSAKDDLVSAINELAAREPGSIAVQGAVIDDDAESEDTTWSSSRIAGELAELQLLEGGGDLPASYNYWPDPTPLTSHALFAMSASTGVPYSTAVTDPYLLYAVRVEPGYTYCLSRYGQVTTDVYAVNDQHIAALGFSSTYPADTGSSYTFSAVGSIQTNYSGDFTVPEGAQWLLMMFREASFLPVLAGNVVSLQRITEEHPEPTYPVEATAPLAIRRGVGLRQSAVFADDELRIEAWGDSLTLGAGAAGDDYLYTGAYPAVLSRLIGHEVLNFGVGGETMETILGRQGALPMMVQPVTIPADRATVPIRLMSITGAEAAPLLQSADKDKGVNPVMISGIPGALTRDAVLGCCFTRSAEGSETSLTHPVPLVTAAMQTRCNNRILLLWLGQNNAGDAELAGDVSLFAGQMIAAARAAIEKAGTDRYLILAAPLSDPNTTSGSTAVYQSLYRRMQYEFGSRYINIVDYLIDHGLADAGVTPTAADAEDVAARRIPASLTADRPHLNAAGYRLVAQQVYERGQLLGYWS